VRIIAGFPRVSEGRPCSSEACPLSLTGPSAGTGRSRSGSADQDVAACGANVLDDRPSGGAARLTQAVLADRSRTPNAPRESASPVPRHARADHLNPCKRAELPNLRAVDHAASANVSRAESPSDAGGIYQYALRKYSAGGACPVTRTDRRSARPESRLSGHPVIKARHGSNACGGQAECFGA
jgi:hypothetical protein